MAKTVLIVEDSHLILQDQDSDQTAILVVNPAAGEWRIEPAEGSARITRTDS